MKDGTYGRRGEVLVDIENLRIGFPGKNDNKDLVDGIDLCIRAGECVALVGESGSGKSLTARSILNLAGKGARMSARRYEIGGRNALRFTLQEWRDVRGRFAGLVMQDALVSLDPLRQIGQEVGETVAVHGLLRGERAVRGRVLDALAQAGIPDPQARSRQYAHQLSGGLRQRALIAAAIAAHPRLIIADEPTTALDATVQKQVIEVLMRRVREDGVGLLLISHDLSVVSDIADCVLVMRGGRVVDDGSTREVLSHPRHDYTRALIAAVPSAESRGYRLASARIETGAADDQTVARILREPLPPRAALGGEVILRAEGLGKRYWQQRGGGEFQALDEVSFEIRAGEVLGLVGESGSGKSTCAKIVLGLLEPDAGGVSLLGKPWSGIPERCRRALRPKLQYIPQDPLSSFDPRYTVRDIILENLPRVLGWAELDRRVRGLLAQVGLDERLIDRLPATLSGGQRQRVAIARALAAEPALIVCDEPVSALDVSIQAQVIDLIGELQARMGTALLFISHDIGLVRHVADRVLVLQQGRVVEQGEAGQVLTHPRHSYTRTLLDAVPGAWRQVA
ncbi:ATP-binding cassette domain-containing protein [Bordetella tumulicola]|uniref:ATP-binding cassette domain-containing protein n=1 Tax=Bordetella tumulicola TaxID=1649133 RepID=UPI0039EEFFB1